MIPANRSIRSLASRPGARTWLTALLVLGGLSARALDFEVRSVLVDQEGAPREQFTFQNDALTRVQVCFPSGWSHAETPAAITLTPPDVTNGMVRIEKSNLGPDIPFRDKGLETYRHRVLANVPAGATALKPGEEAADPLPIFGWKSYEYTLDYEFFGQAYRRSVLFLNLNPKEQLMMTTVALKGDYDRVHARGMDVMRSWQVVPGHG